MSTLIKILKIGLLLVGILVGLAILAGVYLIYTGIRSGNLSEYIQKTVLETVLNKEDLSPTQQQLLESGNLEELVNDLQQNITPEQVDCAVQTLGTERAQELAVKQNPTPQEILLLAKCL